MKKGWLWVIGLLLAASLLAAPASLFAKSDEGDEDEVSGSVAILSEEVMRANMAKVTLVEAVGAAVKKAPGKAISAELEDEDGFLAYVVEIVGADNKVTEVTVDAGNKKILKTEEQGEEGEEGEEDEDVRYRGKHSWGKHKWGKHRGGEEEDD